MNIDPLDKKAVYRRDALDDYERFIGLEKKKRY